MEPAPHTAAAIIVGNEILSGKIRDENGPYLLRGLRALGVEVRRVETVPDEEAAIVDAVQRCRSLAAHLFTSGGIGTTHDDLTVPSVAKALGRQVIHHPDIVALLETRWGKGLSPNRLRLAEVPEGGEVLWGQNRELVFPAIAAENVLILPGVPELFVEKFDALKERYRSPPIALVTFFLSVGEGRIAQTLTEATELFAGVAIGSYPRFDSAGYKVKVTVESRDAEQCARCATFLREKLKDGILRVE